MKERPQTPPSPPATSDPDPSPSPTPSPPAGSRSGGFSYLVRGLLATGVLVFALSLSRGDRGPVDFVVLGLIGAAILWNLIQLSRRLHAHRGGRGVWHVQRTALFWLIGGWNTLWIRPEDVGSMKNWIGWIVLALAVIDSFVLWREERAVLAHPPDGTARERSA